MVALWCKRGISDVRDVETDDEPAADPSRHAGAASAVGRPLAALALTLATSAWIAFLLLHPLARGIKFLVPALPSRW